MAINKTQPSEQSVETFIESIENKERRKDAQKLTQLIKQVTGSDPVMWGSSIIGFGTYHYKYASGREGDTMKIGLAPRKQALVIYGLIFYEENKNNNELVSKLGSYSSGKGCLYIKSLEDIDLEILKQMIANSYS